MIKNVAVVSLTTLLSRVLGYFRDVVIASFLGAGPVNDAFIAAFKFTNLFRSLFGEGALTAAFVPIFNHKLSNEGQKKAIAMAAAVQSILIVSLIFFTICVLMSMPFVVNCTAPGFKVNHEQFILAVELGRITFPYLFFISLAAFYGGILHSIGKFMPFAATSIILNLSIILFALYFGNDDNKVYAIAYGVLTAGFLELIWMLFFLKSNNIVCPLTWPKLTHDIRALLQRMGAGALGFGVVQINTWVDIVIVSFIPGGMSYIYYADRVMQLPLALIATATSTVLLPSLAKYVASDSAVQAYNTQDRAISITGFFLLPTTLVFATFAHDIIALLLERGMFNAESTNKTAKAFAVISLGLPAFAMIKLFNNAFHARGDTKTPARFALVGLIINVVISLSLLSRLQHVAVSVASMSAAWCVAIGLILVARTKNYYNFSSQIICQLAIYTAASVIATYIIDCAMQRASIIAALPIGAVAYIATCYLGLKFFSFSYSGKS